MYFQNIEYYSALFPLPLSQVHNHTPSARIPTGARTTSSTTMARCPRHLPNKTHTPPKHRPPPK